ncbi:MAG: transketolase family protein, partial [Candidatus Omnitrophica bacterium]|nr:transketolase family protein [Candidatus Omnitrophota bacterium]
KAYTLTEGSDITIIACGIMVNEALQAQAALSLKGIKARLINMHTIKPLDEEAVIKAASQTKGIVVCEEHSVIGGLASAVDEVVAEKRPTYVMRVGVRHRFGQSGEPAELMQEYGLTTREIVAAALKILKDAK